MYKGSDVIGKGVVIYDTGERAQKVRDLLFDQDSNRLLGFLVNEGGWFSSARVIMLKDVQALGPNAVVIPSKSVITKSKEVPEIEQIRKRNNVLKGTRIMTTDGRDLGTMADLYFNEETGAVEGYEVSGGLFADLYSGRSFVPAPHTLNIGEDVAFVPPEIADLMQEQVGGIKGAAQTASGKLQETSQVAGQKIQETSQAAGQKIQETSQAAGGKLQETSQAANGKIQGAAQTSSASLTNAAVDPAEQKAFVIGKTVNQAIIASDGTQLIDAGESVTPLVAEVAESLGLLDQLYRATGGSHTVKLNRTINTAIASRLVGQAKGRRAQEAVRTPEGSFIAAPGQIVTEQVIERARTYHKESELLSAVGLTHKEAVRSSASGFLSATGKQLRGGASQAQDNVGPMWEQIKEKATHIQHSSTQTLEKQRIKRALGRPVTRVILDPQDEVILNVGELITHRAIEYSRQGGVLDILLSSVYDKQPDLSTQEMRASEPGKASLEKENRHRDGKERPSYQPLSTIQ